MQSLCVLVYKSTGHEKSYIDTTRNRSKLQKEKLTAIVPVHRGFQSASLQIWSTHGWKRGYWTVINPNSSFESPVEVEPNVGETSLMWMERIIAIEEQRLKAQEDHVYKMTQSNERMIP
jgi:hypothetical protein